MSERTCGGECCAVFWLEPDLVQRADKIDDGAFIADMVIPLTRRQALRRWRKFVSTERPLPRSGRRIAHTCRHWDEKTRLCTVYDERPKMCRDYPYGGPCSHGCDYQVDEETASHYDTNWLWDEAAKGWRPRSNSNFLWDAKHGVLRPIPKETPA